MPLHGKHTRVLVDDKNLSTYFRESTMAQEVDMADTSTYGNDYKTFIQGLATANLSLSGLYDGAVGANDEELASQIGSTVLCPVTVGLDGLARGKRLYTIGSDASTYEVSSTIGDVVAVSAQFVAKNPSGRIGISLKDLAAETASTTHTSVDETAATTKGGYGILHVTAASGTTPTLDVKIQHSTDNATFTDLITFAQATAAKSEFKSVTGTVNRYVRVVSTIGGITPSFTYHVNFTRLP